MSMQQEEKIIINEDKEHKMEEMKNKVDNLFAHAKKVISKEDFIKTIKIVGSGIKDIMMMAYYAGISIVGFVYEQICKFISWIKAQYNESAAKFAQKHLQNKVSAS